MNAEELKKYATEKQFFGVHECLFACEDNNIYVKEEDALSHSEARNCKYFKITKDSKNDKK